MPASYEFWLCDDYGRRLSLLKDISFVSYSRSTLGYGTCQIGIPYEYYLQENIPDWRPDWRLDIWRSPLTGIPARRECSFLLRKINIYERKEDGVKILEMLGRSPIDLLRRQSYKGTSSITDYADKIMKTVVRTQFVTTPGVYSTAPTTYNGLVYTYTGEFSVDPDSLDGPIITDNYYLKNCLDICQDIQKTTKTLNLASPSNLKILFDVVEDEGIGMKGGFGYRFITYPTRRGANRTNGLIFSTENGNIQSPVYYEDYLDEITSSFKYNSSQIWASQNIQSADQYLSRWNYIEKSDTNNDVDSASALNEAYIELQENGAQKIFNCDFVNSPGSAILPRSLYGVDWDLGDLLPVKFANKSINAEVEIVYISLDENGSENILGKTQVGA